MASTAHDLCGFTLTRWNRLPLTYRLRFAAGLYLGWRYHRIDVGFAFASPGVPESLIRPPFTQHTINCSTLTASVLTACFPSSPWGSRGYGDLQVFADRLPDNPDSPIQAVEHAGIGSRVADTFAPNMWHLVQGWRTLDPPRGHAFLMRDDGDSLLVLEATTNIGPRWKRTTRKRLHRDYPAALYAAAIGEGVRG